jgi:hypothetical protein
VAKLMVGLAPFNRRRPPTRSARNWRTLVIKIGKASLPVLGTDVSLYLVAKGGQPKGNSDNPAIALLTVLGNTPPANVVINEMTTVASVWTNNQFLDGTAPCVSAA